MNNNVLIIGGGPAGLEAAAQLQGLGYNTILIEKTDKLGGHLAKWDRLFPASQSAKELLDTLLQNINGVKCFLNTDVNSINVLDKSYNVILSNGITILADAVLLASGFDLFKAEKKEEYGYEIYDRVITNADLEQYYKTKCDNRIQNPKSIGFIHCVGSRDEKVGNLACSKVCCATAVKQACEIKQEFPEAEVYCFYMDLRMFGRNYEDLYLKAQKQYDIRFIRGRVSEVSEQQDKTLIVKAEDTLSSKPIKITLDILVLMAGMRPSEAGEKIGDMLQISKEDDGFFTTKDSVYSLQKSNLPGLFFAGACTGPKTIPDTLHEARSSALEIHEYLVKNFSDRK
ncbi:MAG TPA: FAD-dependent oxidoreductase [Candidatus Egerieousia sp.]|nr:FAD-dependent oxidoreductase [Candidatus Egerieousia sp.]HPT05341.1 FAD-dependent oxidoreductase [Candidatus Egerieousia sp.]